MFPFLCFVTRQHQPRVLDNAGSSSVCNQVCFGTCEQGSYIMTPTWTKEVLLYDHCRRFHGRGSSLLCCKGICLFNFLQVLIFNIFFISKASERGGHPESATYSIILLLKLKICRCQPVFLSFSWQYQSMSQQGTLMMTCIVKTVCPYP